MRKFTKYPQGYVKADMDMKDFSNTESSASFQDFAYSDGDISDDSVQYEFPDNQDIIEQVIDSWNQGNDTITNFLMDYYGFDEDDIAELDDSKFADCLIVEDIVYDPIESSNQGIPAYRVTIWFDYDKYLKSL